MNNKSQPYSNPILSGKILVWICILTVLLISLLDLMGWIFGITIFKSIEDQWIPMKVVTAICFILSASSLIIISKKSLSHLIAVVPKIAGLLVFIIALFSCWVHLVLLITGNESLLSKAPVLKFFLAFDNRMALLTAVNFIIIGSIVILLSFNKKIWITTT